MIEFLTLEDPDMILLQEVTRGNLVCEEGVVPDVFQRLSKGLGLSGVFSPMWATHRGGKSWELGLAIFSKHSIESYASKFYSKNLESFPRGGDNFPGLLLDLGVRTKAGVLRVLTTHFPWSLHPEITPQQLAAAVQLRELLNVIPEFVLAGDFNVTDESEVYRIISEDMIDDRPKTLKNTLHPTIHGVGGEKELAVDYLFHKGERIRLVESGVPVVDVSDHLPIIAIYDVA
ncbi:MAG: hypothetical protein GX573_26435 [Chloroflexi bacterium]|nr:hypothetical protein [Chloroflexota bacterium]